MENYLLGRLFFLLCSGNLTPFVKIVAQFWYSSDQFILHGIRLAMGSLFSESVLTYSAFLSSSVETLKMLSTAIVLSVRSSTWVSVKMNFRLWMMALIADGLFKSLGKLFSYLRASIHQSKSLG